MAFVTGAIFGSPERHQTRTENDPIHLSYVGDAKLTVQAVIDALNAAFYTAFKGVAPTGRRLLHPLASSQGHRRAEA
jgi:hypothetical protein